MQFELYSLLFPFRSAIQVKKSISSERVLSILLRLPISQAKVTLSFCTACECDACRKFRSAVPLAFDTLDATVLMK